MYLSSYSVKIFSSYSIYLALFAFDNSFLFNTYILLTKGPFKNGKESIYNVLIISINPDLIGCKNEG